MIFVHRQDGEEREKNYFAFLPVRVNDRATVWLEGYFEIHKYDAKEKRWKPYKRGFTRNGSAWWLGSWQNNINYYGREMPCDTSSSFWHSLQRLLKDVASNLSRLRR